MIPCIEFYSSSYLVSNSFANLLWLNPVWLAPTFLPDLILWSRVSNVVVCLSKLYLQMQSYFISNFSHFLSGPGCGFWQLCLVYDSLQFMHLISAVPYTGTYAYSTHEQSPILQLKSFLSFRLGMCSLNRWPQKHRLDGPTILQSLFLGFTQFT